METVTGELFGLGIVKICFTDWFLWCPVTFYPERIALPRSVLPGYSTIQQMNESYTVITSGNEGTDCNCTEEPDSTNYMAGLILRGCR